MKVEREIGKMLGHNTRAEKLFKVDVTKTEEDAARIEWSKVEATRDWATLSAGCYLLRTNVADWSDEELWKAYTQLTEAEAAFRIHKSDWVSSVTKRAWAANPVECWRNSPISARWTSCCPLGRVSRSGPDVSPSPPITNKSCWKSSASNYHQKESRRKYSENFHPETQKTQSFLIELGKSG